MPDTYLRKIIVNPIILASASPRRQEILKLMGIPFDVRPASVDENYPPSMGCDDVAEYLARKKVLSVVESFPSGQKVPWSLGADTVIVFEGKIYGKPSSRDEAASFLSQLQGHTHKVVTGLALYDGDRKIVVSRSSVNLVTFKAMSKGEIEWYIGTGEWRDAAGAYKIQGLASCFISKIEGTESSVMGLPMFEVYDMLSEQGYSIAE